MTNSVGARIVAVSIVLAAHLSVISQTNPPNSVSQRHSLTQGVGIEEVISTEQSYPVQATAGQYVRLLVDSRGSAFKARIATPSGENVFDAQLPSLSQDPTRLSFIAQLSGLYSIVLTPVKNDGTPRRLVIRLEELRNAVAGDEDRVQAETLTAQAASLVATGGAESLRKAVDKYREALALWQKLGQEIEVARTLLNLGSVSHNLSRPAAALEYYSQALPVWRKLGDRAKEAQTLSATGWSYYSIGDLPKALDNYNQALPIRRELKDLRGQSQTLATIGQIYRSIGEPQRALDYFTQSLELARAAGDKVQQAFALNNFGFQYSDIGEYQKALDATEQAMPLWQETGNRYGEADALTNLGTIYQNLGDSEKALSYHQRALKLWKFLGNRGGEADALNNLGIVYWGDHSLEQALDYFNQSLALRKILGEKLGEAFVLNNLGLVYEDQGERDKALEAFLTATQLSPADSSAVVNICRNYEFRNEHAKALDYCQRGLTAVRERGDKAGEAAVLGMMAEVQLSLGNVTEALKDSKSAVEMLETIDNSLRGADPRISFRSFTTNYYALLINVLSNLHRQAPTAGYEVTAFELSERARARGLLELLSNARVDLRQGVDPVLLRREKEIQYLLNSKERYRAHLFSKDRHSSELPTVESEVSALVIEQQELIAKIRANSPRYSALTKPASLSLREIQRTVVDDDTVLLEYDLGERAVLWAVTPNSITIHQLPLRSEIEAMARQVYHSLNARNSSLPNETLKMRLARMETAEKEYETAAAKLSETLLGPVANQLGRKRLVFVTDGILQYIPFAALPIPHANEKSNASCASCRSKPLITEHEIVSLPSASVLSVLRKEVSERKRAPKEVAVIADPVFSINDPRIVSTSVRESVSQRTNGDGNESQLESQLGITGFGRLRFSREEADSIASLVPPNEIFKLTDLAATKQTILTANLDQYRILHFATHSVSNTRWPELSGVVLSLVSQNGEPEDGFLRLNEIYNLKLNADLVVLSGCQTALGKQLRGEGLIGLTRGFMYAGAPRVIASLWSVDDRATAELMKRFYKAVLTQGMRPAAALRAAQVSLLSEKGWDSPYYWAAFNFQGEWK